MKLSPEVEERLALDHALGAMDPDVERLWQEYLGQRREETHGSPELGRLVSDAREVFRCGFETLTLPRRKSILSVRPVRFEKSKFLQAAAAAVLLIGIGFLAGSKARSTQALSAGGSRPDVPERIALAAEPPAERFWSADRYRQSRRSAIQTRYDVQWKSPLKAPQIKESL